jgi:hypothetical protein
MAPPPVPRPAGRHPLPSVPRAGWRSAVRLRCDNGGDPVTGRLQRNGGEQVGDRPPAHPLFSGPSEYVSSATGAPSGHTDRERALLLRLAVHNLCRQFGCTEQAAADALDHFAARGEVLTRGDRRDVYLVVAGAVHIHAERDWLRWAAHGSGSVPSPN